MVVVVYHERIVVAVVAVVCQEQIMVVYWDQIVGDEDGVSGQMGW